MCPSSAQMSRIARKPVPGQPQEMAGCFKLRILEVEGLYILYKSANQLAVMGRFSHDAAKMMSGLVEAVQLFAFWIIFVIHLRIDS